MADHDGPPLRRTLSFGLLTLYGVGTMIGGGFYALLGEVAGAAGMLTPIAIFAAATVALFSALSFGELASRFPVSAGEARYVREAFGRRWLAATVGGLVVATGVVSAATLANAIVGFVQDRTELDRTLGIVVVVAAFGLVTAWGIGESVVAAAVVTVIEVGGLVFVFAVSAGSLGELPARASAVVGEVDVAAWSGVALGAFTIFYAFIGFEDLVNVGEEVREPRRTLPRAILWSLGLTTLLYVLVSTAAVLTVDPADLASSRTPIATVAAGAGVDAGLALAAVSVLAGANGALVQVVMASRVVYGMSRQGDLPSWFARVHPRTRTPLRATAAVTAAILVLALWLPLGTLAQATSTIILVVFTLVNVALWRIQKHAPRGPGEGFRVPRAVPVAGAVLSAGFVVLRLVGIG